jgi:hypothetical protein
MWMPRDTSIERGAANQIAAALGLFEEVARLAGGSRGVEGAYELDKEEVKKAVETELAGQSGGGTVFGFFTTIIDRVDMTMELQADGKVKLKFTLPTGGWAEPGRLQWFTMEDNEGTWESDGETVVVTAGGNSLRCSQSWAKLSCQSEKKFFFPLIFVKS